MCSHDKKNNRMKNSPLLKINEDKEGNPQLREDIGKRFQIKHIIRRALYGPATEWRSEDLFTTGEVLFIPGKKIFHFIKILMLHFFYFKTNV